MALKIEESCVNCWACVDVCPSEAIYQGSQHFRINAHKCTECDDDFADPQCASICPTRSFRPSSRGRSVSARHPASGSRSLRTIPTDRARKLITIWARKSPRAST